MNAEAVLYAVGEMFERNQRQEPDLGATKRKFDAYVRAVAAGKSAEDLTVEEVWALGCSDMEDDTEERLPRDVADALGLDPQTTYGEVIVEARMEVRDHKAA